MKEVIFQKISKELDPGKLEIIDESHLHQGHLGAKPGGETHFKLIISDPLIAKNSRVATHRQIHQILKSELTNQIHALSIIILDK